MNREEDNKNRNDHSEGTSSEKKTGTPRSEDDDQHSYPGKLDAVEGNMNNGEIGGGLQKQDDQNNSHHE